MEKLQFVLKCTNADCGSLYAPPVLRRQYHPGTVHQADSELPLMVYRLPHESDRYYSRTDQLYDVCPEYKRDGKLLLCQARGIVDDVAMADIGQLTNGFVSIDHFRYSFRGMWKNTVGTHGKQPFARGAQWLLVLREVFVGPDGGMTLFDRLNLAP